MKKPVINELDLRNEHYKGIYFEPNNGQKKQEVKKEDVTNRDLRSENYRGFFPERKNQVK